jgi:hypothetical protein
MKHDDTLREEASQGPQIAAPQRAVGAPDPCAKEALDWLDAERRKLVETVASSGARSRARAFWALTRQPAKGTPSTPRLILPRFRGHSDYAANAATWDRNSNSIGLR